MGERKFLILVPDGMGDYPQESIGGKTPLEAAATPAMDELAQKGTVVRLNTIPPECSPGSEIANSVIMGQAIQNGYLPRGALELAAMGIDLPEGKAAYRVNTITLNQERIIIDYSGGHPPDDLAKPLIESFQKWMGEGIMLKHGKSYRSVLVIEGTGEGITSPPHENVGKCIDDIFPKGSPESSLLRDFVEKSLEYFSDRDCGFNALWPWGGGRKPEFINQAEKFGLRSAMITAVDLLKGIAELSGFDNITVPGATGFIDTDYAAKGRYAVNAYREGYDLLYLHVEAPDEAGHMGNLKEKIRSIENIDAHILSPILEYLQSSDNDFSVMILPDHFTPVRLKVHTRDPVPCLVYHSDLPCRGPSQYCEGVTDEQRSVENILQWFIYSASGTQETRGG